VAGTAISKLGYRALLAGLPQVQNIVWTFPVDPILRGITPGLQSVTRFAGNFSDADLLAEKCQNIKEVALLDIAVDMSGLGNLRCVSKLTVILCSCNVMRFSDAIARLGVTLTTLEWSHVYDINMRDIIHSCPVLNSLTFSYCYITNSDVYDPRLAHFQNLKTLQLWGNSGTFDLSSVLHLYVNLSRFHAAKMGVVTDALIKEVVTAGGFRNLTKFSVHRCGHMSMQTAWLLVQNVLNLVQIEQISTWPEVTCADVAKFLTFVRSNNLSLYLPGFMASHD
jgi:hypothetical protein